MKFLCDARSEHFMASGKYSNITFSRIDKLFLNACHISYEV